MSNSNIFIEPANPSAMWLMWKTLIWVIIWILIAFFIFVMLMVFGWLFYEAIRMTVSWNVWANPVLPLIIMIIAFIAALLWNILVAVIYNLFFNYKYYDIWKMLSLSSIINILIFFIVAAIYLIYNKNPEVLLLILAFHIFFAVFISYIIMETSTNPNYAWVHIIWATIWVTISVFIFLVAYKSVNVSVWVWIERLFILPPILSYIIIPLFHWLREKLYYKFYEWWNNFLYIPSLDEVMVDEEEVEEVNVFDN